MDKVYTRGLAVGSLFKIVVIGLGFSLGPLIVFYGFLSMLGAGTVTWNDEPVTGAAGLLLSVVMAPVTVLLFSVVVWLIWVVGNWLYTRFGGITIHYWPEDYP